MTLKSSFLYARKMIFSRSASEKKGEKSQGKKSLIGALLCIGISLIPLVAVLVVSDGMVEGMTGRIIGLSTGHLEVKMSARSSIIKELDSFISARDQIISVDGVREAYAEIQGTALAAGKNGRTGATVRAVEDDLFSRNKSFSSLFKVIEGTTELPDEKSCVVGEYLATTLDLHAGDTIRIINISYGPKNRLIPKYNAYKISGIVSSGYQELDALWVFIPLKKGFETMSPNSAQYVVSIVTDDAFSLDLEKTKSRIQDELMGNGNGPAMDSTFVFTWKELNLSQYENFSSTKILLLLIMLIIVLVASVNISSALVMLVMERKKEIAILKSIGGSAGGITLAFLLTGFACGLGGVIIGIPLGLLVSLNINQIIKFSEKTVNAFAKFSYLLSHRDLDSFNQIHILDPAYYLQQITVSVPYKELIVIIVGTLLLSLLMACIPSIRAGKEKPIDTLRKL